MEKRFRSKIIIIIIRHSLWCRQEKVSCLTVGLSWDCCLLTFTYTAGLLCNGKIRWDCCLLTFTHRAGLLCNGKDTVGLLSPYIHLHSRFAL